jgi:hypothetical protein
MARHGKPKSECCGGSLKKVQNGEWTEWYCTTCNTNVDQDGRLYRYVTVDYTVPPKR